MQQAIIDARAAWTDMGTQGTLPGAILLAPQLNGQVLTSAIYTFSSTADLSAGGVLTLNGPGIFIFDVGSSLTANVLSTVVGTANPCNVYWRMGGGGSATLNGNNFFGTVLADQSVTVASSNILTGRAVGIVAAVTMPGGGGNTIGGCSSAPIIICPVITVNPATLPNGTLGVAYNATVTASGGTGPYTFAVTSGTLPTGLTLNPATGAITGTPTAAGTFDFTITATDASSCPGSRAYSVVISAAAAGAASGGPTLDSLGLAILMVLLAAAGLFAVNRFTS